MKIGINDVEYALEADSPIVTVCVVATLGTNHANHGSLLKRTLEVRESPQTSVSSAIFRLSHK
jgi:hypothetical protein